MPFRGLTQIERSRPFPRNLEDKLDEISRKRSGLYIWKCLAILIASLNWAQKYWRMKTGAFDIEWRFIRFCILVVYVVRLLKNYVIVIVVLVFIVVVLLLYLQWPSSCRWSYISWASKLIGSGDCMALGLRN